MEPLPRKNVQKPASIDGPPSIKTSFKEEYAMSNNAKIATSRLADPGDNWHGPIVEITTDDHMTLVVNLPLSAVDADRDPIDRALGALSELAPAARAARANLGGQPSASARSAQDKDELDAQLDKGLEDSFPASDPVSTVTTTVLPKRANSDR